MTPRQNIAVVWQPSWFWRVRGVKSEEEWFKLEQFQIRTETQRRRFVLIMASHRFPLASVCRERSIVHVSLLFGCHKESITREVSSWVGGAESDQMTCSEAIFSARCHQQSRRRVDRYFGGFVELLSGGTAVDLNQVDSFTELWHGTRENILCPYVTLLLKGKSVCTRGPISTSPSPMLLWPRGPKTKPQKEWTFCVSSSFFEGQ